MSLWDDLERSSGIERTNKPGLWSDIKRSTGQIIESTGSAVRDALPSVGGAIEDVGAGIVRRNPSQINTWDDIKDKPLTTAREAIGEVAPQIGTTLGGGLAGRYVGGVIGGALGGPLGAIAGQQVGAAAGAFLPNLVQGYGGIRKEQREQGIDDKGRALVAGAGAAVLDTALGVEGVATKVLGKGSDILARQAGSSLLKNVGKQAAIGAATEAPTEVLQTGAERWGAKKDLLSPDAYDEYAVSGVKGALGGGFVRGGLASVAGEQPAPTPAPTQPPVTTPAPAQASGGEIQQALQPSPAGKTYTAPNGSIYTQTTPGKWEMTTPAPAAAPAEQTPVTPPIVQGGTTAVAQGAQAVDAENNAIAAAQQQQAKREEVMTTWAIADPQNPTKGQFFGQPVFGTTVPAIADAWGAVAQTMTPVEVELAQAVAAAHADTGNKLISFKLSADKPQQTAQKAGESIKKVLTKFQIADVASVEEAAERLNEQSKTLTGGQLDQVNAIHSALTGGEDTVGYIESQKSEAEKKAAKTKPAAAPAPVVQQPASAPVPADANALVQEQPNGQASQASAAAPVDQGTEVGQQQPQPAADAGLPAGAADQTGQAVQGAGVSEVDAGDAGEARHLTSLRRALDIVIPPHPRQTEDARQGRIQFLLDRYTETYDNLGAVHDDKLSEYAKEYGVSLSTIKRWSASLKKLDKQKLLAAVETAAREQGISLEDVKESWRQAIAETQQKIEALEAQQSGEPEDSGQSTSRAEDGPLESDNVEYKDEAPAEAQDEGAPSEDSVDRNNDGLSEKGRLESLQERGNARDRLGAEYVRVSNKLDRAELDGDDETAAKLAARLREIEDELAELNKKAQRANAKDTETKSDKPTAPKEDKPKSKSVRVVKKTPKVEAKPAAPDLRTEAEKAAAAWDKVAAQYPVAPKFADLTEDQRETFIEYGEENWTEDDVKNELVKLAKSAPKKPTPQLTREPVTIDVEARVVEETVGQQVAALPAPQVQRLENHYGVKSGSPEFLAKVKEDVVAYATKGAEAVSAAIRDIIKAIHAGVLSVAMIFNPGSITAPEAFVIAPPSTTVSYTREVKAELPAEVQGMSDAGKQAYATLIPALKGKIGNKLITIADKPSGRIFVFDASGKLIVQKKALYGLAKGDLYKGNNDLPQNRITPAGLFGLTLVDAAQGGASKVTAGEYDFGKVFAFEDPEATVTIMHSVWLKEKDAGKRAAALKNDSPADSRYSFGCVNVDKVTYKFLLDNYQAQMDGSKLFIVPDEASKVGDFLAGRVPDDRMARQSVTPATETVTETSKPTVATAGEKPAGTPGLPKNERQQRRAASSGARRRSTVNKIRAILRPGAGKRRVLNVENAGVIELQETSFDELKAGPLGGLWTKVHAALQRTQPHLLAQLDGIHFTDADVVAGVLGFEGGVHLLINERQLSDVLARQGSPVRQGNQLYWIMNHELGHVADGVQVYGQGILSSLPEFEVLRADDGRVRSRSGPMREVLTFFNRAMDNPGAFDAAELRVADQLRYPLDDEFAALDDSELSEEVFAQLFAAYHSKQGRVVLAQHMPGALQLMEEVDEIAKDQFAQSQGSRQQGQTLKPTRAVSGRGQVPASKISAIQAAGAARLRQQAIDKLPEPLKAPVKDTWTNLFTYAKQGALALAITQDVVDLAAKHTSAAKDYLAAQFKRQGIRLDFEAKVEDIVRSFEKLSKREQEAVNKLIYDSTRSEKWAYVPTWGTQNRKITVDPALAARHSALSKEAQEVIDATFEHGHNALAAKQDAVRDLLARQFDALEAAAKAANDTEALAEAQADRRKLEVRFQTLLKIKEDKPYAYLGRYGNYVAVAKSAEFIKATAEAALGDKAAQRWLEQNQSNEDHYIVSFAETPAEAANMAAQWRATGKYEQAFHRVKLEEALAAGGNDLVMAVSRLKNLAAAKGDVLDEKVFKALQNLMGELYLQVAAEGSARKTEMQRKNIAGADINMMRNLATSGRADAHFIAGLETNDEIVAAAAQMNKDVQSGAKEGAEYVNELIKRYSNSLEYTPPGPLSSALNKLGITYFLSTNPAFYLQQMLQTAVLTQPYMSGTLGYWNSKRQIEGAYKDLFKMVKGLGLGLDDRIDFTKAPDDVRVMLQTLTAQGKIDLGIEAEARAMAHEKGVLNTVHRKLGHVNTRIESINRAVAAIAAYRGHLQKFGDAAKATVYAAEVVQNTHGNYDGFNTPRAFSNDVGRVIGQFKRFQIIQLSMLAKLLHTSFKGASPEERLVARKALGFIVGHMAALGGVLGVPFVTQLGNILLAVFGDDEEPDDLEYALRKAIGDDAVADLLLRGAPSLVGLESLGKKVSMENVASILPFTDVGSLDRDGMTKILVGLMGPSAALSLKAADAFSLMSQGYLYKGMEQLLPNGFANAMKGLRFASEGITQRNGDVVMPPEDISILDATFQALGLPTDTISDRQRTQRLVKEFDDFYAGKAESIKRDYVRAFEKGDSEDMADARQAWQELQDARVKNGYTRLPVSTLFKAPQEKAKRERSVANGVEYRKQNKQFVESL